ncbi:DUF5695 domain-containing protein [Bacteroides gallinarum]|uniref:DUF5695 domain-containing protein n=1 Tax=Bacteroides gallinarum TaxID=376806 RepID=UPI00037A9874|nr:DUF5695 domain-containing protein [Bacteroides gallinarum]
MELKKYLFSIFVGIIFSTSLGQAITPIIKLDIKERGIASMTYSNSNGGRNYLNKNDYLGNLYVRYIAAGKVYVVKLSDFSPEVISNNSQNIKISWQLPGSIELNQSFSISEMEVNWDITIYNRNKQTIEITDMRVHIPIGERNEALPAKDNLAKHIFLNGNSSFIYWLPYHGQGNVLLMTMKNGTSLEYKELGDYYYIHSKTSIERMNDTWRFPSTSKVISSNKSYTTGFNFSLVEKYTDIQDKLYDKENVVVKIVPGMVVSPEMKVHCAIASKQKIKILESEHPQQIQIINKGKLNKKYLYDFRFSRLGENMITIKYGKGKICYLNFYVTEPLENVIKKRANFIVTHQQHRDSTKWYNGLYSLWDMENKVLLSPDNIGGLPYPYMVGGSDDPSNCKALYLSEKNVVYPNKDEIASLEYYEKNFVWGKLQRTDKEYPYPYGIYGCDNWYELRSGALGDYNSGGSGKERMWRTYDYPTHFTIYYNLYRIAKDYPYLVNYLDAKGYLERAYRTAMAYFEVPYNIFMGKQWAIKGWSDWAYKIGNFHERYLLDIIKALKTEGRNNAAETLRKEWEKKVLYMIYEDSWPFGSEMFVDRTAYESSYYVAEYAKFHKIIPQEQLWYDKNKHKWYSYKSLDTTRVDCFMKNQLDGNLAIRGLYEFDFGHLGTAWSGGKDNLDYMSQLGGVAILDYAFRFSDTPEKYVNWGYNSLLSSWALVNTGTKDTNYGYWYNGKMNDGAAGWIYSPYQHSYLWNLKSVKQKRGPLQYDGEIDHGLTGGIRGSGIYLLKDSDLGLIAYGGNAEVDKKGNISIIPYDGIRRQLRIFTPIPMAVELKKDGFMKNKPILYKDNEICFFLENREGKDHDTRILIESKVCCPTISISVSNKSVIVQEVSSGLYEAHIPMKGKVADVKIRFQH